MQPRLQAVATRDANVCVPKVNRSSPPKITFSHPNFHVHRSTWQSHPDGHSGLKRPSEDLFKRIRREKNHPKQMKFLHKPPQMCNNFPSSGIKNPRNPSFILKANIPYKQHYDKYTEHHICKCSHMGSDDKVVLSNSDRIVSIHAPTWGATTCLWSLASIRVL